jgi:hypothetical protein
MSFITVLAAGGLDRFSSLELSSRMRVTQKTNNCNTSFCFTQIIADVVIPISEITVNQ